MASARELVRWPAPTAVGAAATAAALILAVVEDGAAFLLLPAGIMLGAGAARTVTDRGEAELGRREALRIGLARARREGAGADLLLVDCTELAPRVFARLHATLRITDAAVAERRNGRRELLVLIPAGHANGNGVPVADGVARRLSHVAGAPLPTAVAQYPADGWTLDALAARARARAYESAPALRRRRRRGSHPRRLRIPIPERRPTR